MITTNKFAGWLDDFIDGLNTNKLEKTADLEKDNEPLVDEKVVITEININDLPKVVWNDETYYININDDSTAEILNKFGNQVAVLENVKSIDDVNQQLNSKQVVSNINVDLDKEAILDNEFSKAMAYINDNPSNNIEHTAEYSNLLDRIAKLEETVATLQEQVYARTDPGNIYDLNVMEQEIDNYTKAAEETIIQIDNQSNLDITIPKGRTVDYINMKQNTTAETENDEIKEASIEDNNLLNNILNDESDELDTFIELDNENDINKFQDTICPGCDEESLIIIDADADETFIQCKSCGRKYYVDMNTEKIYKENEV